jgi:nitrous oxidase accessory protein
MKIGLLAVIWLNSVCAFASIIEVGGSAKFSRLKDALAQCFDGDTIIVHEGVYFEGNIIVDKRICLLGDGWPILDGENQFEVLSIKHDSVVVKGFKVMNSGLSGNIDYAGIKIYDSNKVVIENNVLENTFFGIYTQFGKGCIIRDNVLTSNGGEEIHCGNGIHCWKCDSMQIIHNTIKGHRDGIYFEFVTHSIIWRNISLANVRYGLHFMFSNNDHYVANVFEENGAGVAVMFSKQVSMHGNYFANNWGDAAYGILLKEISDGAIEGNTFVQNTTGIFMEGVNRIVMNRNAFIGNGWGLKIQASCMDIVLKRNDFIGNSFDVGTNGSLVLNTFSNNYWDNYEGYDLDHDGVGDVPYRPVSLYSIIVEQNPTAMMLFRSFITTVMDKTERVMPSLIPENLVDKEPLLKPSVV